MLFYDNENGKNILSIKENRDERMGKSTEWLFI